MNKNLIKIIIIVLLFTLQSSCKRKGRNENEILFWHAMSGRLGKVLDDMIEQYNSTGPEYSIKGVYKGNYGTLMKSIMVSIPAHTTPDIAQVYENWLTNLIDSELIVSLDEYVYNQEIGLTEEEFNDIYKVYIENNKIDDVLWSLPFNKSVPVLFYNKELFSKVGLDPEKAPETWDDFLEYCKILTIDSNEDGRPEVWGYAFSPSVWIYECILLQMGGTITNKEETKPTFHLKEGQKALQLWYDMLYKDKVAFKYSGFDGQNNFAAGEVGMLITSIVSKSFIEHKLTFDWDIAPMPFQKKRAVILSGTNVAIFKSNDEKQKGAWKFLKWFIEPENTAYWSINTGYLPVRKSSLETELMIDYIKKDRKVLVGISELDNAYFDPKVKGWYNSRDILSDAIDRALLQTISIEKALNRAAKRVELELRE